MTCNPQLVTRNYFIAYTLHTTPNPLFFIKIVGKSYDLNKFSFLNCSVYKIWFLLVISVTLNT